MSTLFLPFLLGAVLGTRFRVLMLFQGIGAAVAVVLVAGLAGGNGLFVVATGAALAVCCVQLGYFTGMLMRGLSPRRAGSVAKFRDQSN